MGAPVPGIIIGNAGKLKGPDTLPTGTSYLTLDENGQIDHTSQGGGGGGSGPAFTFNQNSPSSVWVVFHNLARKPAITVIRSDNVVTFGQISYPNNQSALIQFTSAISGSALCY
jgi:hypothetical protein